MLRKAYLIEQIQFQKKMRIEDDLLLLFGSGLALLLLRALDGLLALVLYHAPRLLELLAELVPQVLVLSIHGVLRLNRTYRYSARKFI
jgi:hypothetical protein